MTLANLEMLPGAVLWLGYMLWQSPSMGSPVLPGWLEYIQCSLALRMVATCFRLCLEPLHPFISLHFPSFPFISLHFPSFPFISLHFTSFHFISLHFTSFHFISLHFTSFPFISLHFPSFHFISLHFTSFHFISLHFTSFHFISLHFTSFHLISLHFTSFHFILLHFMSFILYHFISSWHSAQANHKTDDGRKWRGLPQPFAGHRRFCSGLLSFLKADRRSISGKLSIAGNWAQRFRTTWRWLLCTCLRIQDLATSGIGSFLGPLWIQGVKDETGDGRLLSASKFMIRCNASAAGESLHRRWWGMFLPLLLVALALSAQMKRTVGANVENEWKWTLIAFQIVSCYHLLFQVTTASFFSMMERHGQQALLQRSSHLILLFCSTRTVHVSRRRGAYLAAFKPSHFIVLLY